MDSQAVKICQYYNTPNFESFKIYFTVGNTISGSVSNAQIASVSPGRSESVTSNTARSST